MFPQAFATIQSLKSVRKRSEMIWKLCTSNVLQMEQGGWVGVGVQMEQGGWVGVGVQMEQKGGWV